MPLFVCCYVTVDYVVLRLDYVLVCVGCASLRYGWLPLILRLFRCDSFPRLRCHLYHTFSVHGYVCVAIPTFLRVVPVYRCSVPVVGSVCRSVALPVVVVTFCDCWRLPVAVRVRVLVVIVDCYLLFPYR